MKKNKPVNLVFISPLLDWLDRIPGVIVILIAAWLATTAAFLASCSSDLFNSADALSSATILMSETNKPDGASLLDERCSVCHSADTARRKKKTPAQWEQTINRMISNGAKLTEDERAVLLDYLAKKDEEGVY